jgi:hypothetical protein
MTSACNLPKDMILVDAPFWLNPHIQSFLTISVDALIVPITN